jgi:hypothetical protein
MDDFEMEAFLSRKTPTFPTKELTDAFIEYERSFGDHWKQLVDFLSPLTKAQERGFAKVILAALEQGRRVSALEVSQVYGRDREPNDDLVF